MATTRQVTCKRLSCKKQIHTSTWALGPGWGSFQSRHGLPAHSSPNPLIWAQPEQDTPGTKEAEPGATF